MEYKHLDPALLEVARDGRVHELIEPEAVGLVGEPVVEDARALVVHQLDEGLVVLDIRRLNLHDAGDTPARRIIIKTVR